jgi:hypothetical protein
MILKRIARTIGTALIFPALALAQAPAQDQMLNVKGGHRLGETAVQFFDEGFEKQALGACATGDYKGIDKANRRELKKYCAELAQARQQATSGIRYEYKGGGDLTEFRTDTFTFDAAHLVRVEFVFATPNAEGNYRGESFDQIFAGLKQAYGPPAREGTETVRNIYGVSYVAHRELWLTPEAAILITEQPGESGSTTLAAFSRAEYDRTMTGLLPKSSNPLQ